MYYDFISLSLYLGVTELHHSIPLKFFFKFFFLFFYISHRTCFRFVAKKMILKDGLLHFALKLLYFFILKKKSDHDEEFTMN